jgi:hypothetical protein
MKDLLWLVNHPLWGNVVGIPTSQNPNTPEGLEDRLSVRIHRILAVLPHSTEPELGKLHRNRTDSDRASTLELLQGLPTSQEVLRLSEPHLSLSALQEWTWEHHSEPNLTLFTLSTRGSTMVFIEGVRRCCGQRLGCGAHFIGQPTMRLGTTFPPCTAFPTLDTPLTDLLRHVVKTVFGNVPTHGRRAKVIWPTSHTLARLSLCFVPHHPLVSYCLSLCLILDIMRICMDFGPYGAFPSSDVPEMVDQQNSWNWLVIRTYFYILNET